MNSGNIQERLNAAVEEGSMEEMKKSISHLKQQLKIPEDVAKAMSVIAQGSLDFSTGQVINVDGGFHLRRL